MATTAPSGTQWTIRYRQQSASIVEIGGGLRGYADGDWEILDGYTEDEMCPAAAGQVLAPWPNRVRDGRYRFGDQTHQLALSEPPLHNAIHGLVHWLPWRLVEQSQSALTLACELTPQPGYPWRLRLSTAYRLDDDGLHVVHHAENTAGGTAPFGLGAHPYVQIPGVPVDDLSLTVPARTRLLVDARRLPIGAAKVDGGEFDFTKPRRVGSSCLDTAFGDLVRHQDGGSAVGVAAEDGRTVTVWADAGFSWWQVFSSHSLTGPRRRRSLAVEPMTCPPDALRSGRDLIRLEPGATWSGSWGIRPTASGGPTVTGQQASRKSPGLA